MVYAEVVCRFTQSPGSSCPFKPKSSSSKGFPLQVTSERQPKVAAVCHRSGKPPIGIWQDLVGQFCMFWGVDCQILWQFCRGLCTRHFLSQKLHVSVSKSKKKDCGAKPCVKFFGFSAATLRKIINDQTPFPNGQDGMSERSQHASKVLQTFSLLTATNLFALQLMKFWGCYTHPSIEVHLWPICVFVRFGGWQNETFATIVAVYSTLQGFRFIPGCRRNTLKHCVLLHRVKLLTSIWRSCRQIIFQPKIGAETEA